MKRILIILIGLLIVGCSYNNPEVFARKYGGFHIEKCIEDFGPPAFIDETQDGGYLYVWHRQFTYQIAGGQITSRRIGNTTFMHYDPPVDMQGSSTLTIWTDKNKIVNKYKIKRR